MEVVFGVLQTDLELDNSCDITFMTYQQKWLLEKTMRVLNTEIMLSISLPTSKKKFKGAK